MTPYEKLQAGEVADFGGADLDLQVFRKIVLGIDCDISQAAPRCVVTNAVVRNVLDLRDARRRDGSSLPALEFHSCSFYEGFCADGAHLERLVLRSCSFSANENITNVPWPTIPASETTSQSSRRWQKLRKPLNCISLRNCRIETELKLEYLTPVDFGGDLGVLTVDAFAVRIGTNFYVSNTCLRAPQGESNQISEEPHYALHLATATIAGDVQLMPAVVLEGGLKMRDAHLSGSFWAMDLAVTDGESTVSRNQLAKRGFEPRYAFRMDTTEVEGNVMLSSYAGVPFSSKGVVSLLNASIQGDLRVDGDMSGALMISGCRVGGLISLEGSVRTLYGQQLTAGGDLTIAFRQLLRLQLAGANVGGTFNVGDSEFVQNGLPEARAISSQRLLACYEGFEYIEIVFSVDDVEPYRVASFLVPAELSDPRKAVVLDGNSSAIHQLNAQTPSPLKLNSTQNVREYLKLFCASVWGRQGSFAIIDDVSGLPDSMNGSAIDQQRLCAVVVEDGDAWRAKAYVRYADDLYASDFLIKADGKISMENDEEVDSYRSRVDKQALSEFMPPYRFPHVIDRPFSSDFLGKDSSYVAIDPTSKNTEKMKACLTALLKYPDQPTADLSNASCKQIQDWKPLGNVEDWNASDERGERRKLVWPRSTRLHDFDYQHLSEEDEKLDRKKRLAWVRGITAPPESGLLRFTRLTLTLILAYVLVRFSYLIALVWPWPHIGNLTADSSAHLGWRTIFAFSILASCFCAYLRTRVWKPAKSSLSVQPYAHLASVLRERGDDDFARDVEAEKMWQEAVSRGKVQFRHWMAQHLVWRPYGVMFKFGLSPSRAFWSLVFMWCIGWGSVFALSRNGMLRTSVSRVAPAVSLKNRPAQEALANGPHLIEADYSCDENIEPALYAFELMTPVVNLHQESRCEIRSKPKIGTRDEPFKISFLKEHSLSPIFSYGWFWEYAKALYMLLGSVVTSLSVLTFSGIARRWEH